MPVEWLADRSNLPCTDLVRLRALAPLLDFTAVCRRASQIACRFLSKAQAAWPCGATPKHHDFIMCECYSQNLALDLRVNALIKTSIAPTRLCKCIT